MTTLRLILGDQLSDGISEVVPPASGYALHPKGQNQRQAAWH